ncbi:hypothetical protein VOLCADRAFT_84545 [Volvox carteri f. nagariensis]|uniref:THIF-type NAD/FAD binding fold domain-containing protein n=1 Tax=Volvox carteri f. nagariensis TaxID=3068 RepID=D8UJ05_VOLCA|nr:uncharacterized protein VOLCADRAFT_84545 [Volvox carteri f. nagariensis]EFJ40312.1 hypothetical protein VOLCADRAFT_84545 [Volvox carteri f. nagariensis]|eukprot:XP_002958646.1 hypothetical protein VOLCADRAFT_84545 [Volvox carteri f. nagariensis]
MSDDWRSKSLYLTAGALIGAGAAYVAYSYIGVRRAAAAQAASNIPAKCNVPGGASLEKFLQDEVLTEQLTRNVQFFGEEGQLEIAKSFVIIVGLGGVGSHAAHLLLRSGVGRMRLIDFDQVTLSSLNRHAVATREDVGTPKATCLEKHFRRILPESHIEAVVQMYTAEAEDELLGGQPDFVIDAIDNIDTKVALVAACQRRGLRVLSVAGAGAKADPTRLKFVDISESSVDPLARALRTRLRKQHGVFGGIPVLLSTEKPRCKLVSLADMETGNPLDYQIVPNFRVRTIPVLGTTPAIFGMAAAGYVLCSLAGPSHAIEGEPIIKLTAVQYERALERLRDRERARFGSDEGVAVDLDDIVFLLREAWRGFSAREPQRVVAPGGDKGLMRSTAHLTFTRWDPNKPCTADNLVLLAGPEADSHDALPSLDVLRSSEPELVARVEAILDRVKRELFF